MRIVALANRILATCLLLAGSVPVFAAQRVCVVEAAQIVVPMSTCHMVCCAPVLEVKSCCAAEASEPSIGNLDEPTVACPSCGCHCETRILSLRDTGSAVLPTIKHPIDDFAIPSSALAYLDHSIEIEIFQVFGDPTRGPPPKSIRDSDPCRAPPDFFLFRLVNT